MSSATDAPLNETTIESLLLYEDSGGNVTAFLKFRKPCGDNGCPRSSWVDGSRKGSSLPGSDLSDFELNPDSINTMNDLAQHPKLSTPFASTGSFPNPEAYGIVMMICASGEYIGESEISSCNPVMDLNYELRGNVSIGNFSEGM